MMIISSTGLMNGNSLFINDLPNVMDPGIDRKLFVADGTMAQNADDIRRHMLLQANDDNRFHLSDEWQLAVH